MKFEEKQTSGIEKNCIVPINLNGKSLGRTLFLNRKLQSEGVTFHRMKKVFGRKSHSTEENSKIVWYSLLYKNREKVVHPGIRWTPMLKQPRTHLCQVFVLSARWEQVKEIYRILSVVWYQKKAVNIACVYKRKRRLKIVQN